MFNHIEKFRQGKPCIEGNHGPPGPWHCIGILIETVAVLRQNTNAVRIFKPKPVKGTGQTHYPVQNLLIGLYTPFKNCGQMFRLQLHGPEKCIYNMHIRPPRTPVITSDEVV